MDTRRIEYRDGMPFYPVTNPVNQADGLVIENLQLQQILDYLKIWSCWIFLEAMKYPVFRLSES